MSLANVQTRYWLLLSVWHVSWNFQRTNCCFFHQTSSLSRSPSQRGARTVQRNSFWPANDEEEEKKCEKYAIWIVCHGVRHIGKDTFKVFLPDQISCEGQLMRDCFACWSCIRGNVVESGTSTVTNVVLGNSQLVYRLIRWYIYFSLFIKLHIRFKLHHCLENWGNAW